ncbi:hypothetical protein C8531_04020 [Salmonella enterica subsp. enterica serovar Muenchen]|nr:hypothetical protein [Salmonella enterica subsp. enterica serovar Muenchen]
MLDKTKATMPGRQCSTENKEPNKHTRLAAGGQSVSTVHFCILGTAPLARLTLNHQSPEFSRATILKIVGCVLRVGGTALQHTQYFPQWGECEPVAGTLFLRTSLGCVQILPLCSPVLGRSNIGYQPLGSSLGFLRWRRFISPRIEATINCDVLSSLSLTSSIASTTSCGTLAFRACDFAFFVPVAITDSPLYWWATVYTKKGRRKALTWATPYNYSGPHLDFIKVENNEAPRVSLPLAGLLTNNRYHGAKNG